MIDRPPPHLYRYLSVADEKPDEKRMDWIRRALIESKIYFPPHTLFNDPLDCKIPPCLSASALTREQFWRNQVNKDYPNENRIQRKARAEYYCHRSKSKGDQEDLAAEILKTHDKHGIVCLSKHADEMLMWSHYARGHTGIVMRFRVNQDLVGQIREQVTAIKIDYCKEFPCVDFYKSSPEELIRGIFGSKAKNWGYEGEWRLIAAGYTGYIKVPAAMIDGVVFGLKTREQDEATIRELVSERKAPTELFRIQQKLRSFELAMVPA